jgi:hypothetical protein
MASPASIAKHPLHPVLTYQAHSEPIAMLFYKAAQFPDDYRGGALVAMRESWNRKPATGYKVVHIRFENGQLRAFEDLRIDFLINDGQAYFGRPAGLAVARDGVLLVSDDTNGVIDHIVYMAKESRRLTLSRWKPADLPRASLLSDDVVVTERPCRIHTTRVIPLCSRSLCGMLRSLTACP